MEAYGITDRGKVRRQNQDAFWISCDKSPAPISEIFCATQLYPPIRRCTSSADRTTL